MGTTRFFTKAITTPRTITGTEGVMKLSISVISGSCDVEGDFEFNGEAPGPVTLSAGQTDLLVASSPNSPIGGVTITPSGGTTNIEMSF